MMKSILVFSLAAALSLSGGSLVEREPLHGGAPHTFQRENVLGTSFDLKVIAPTGEVASQAESAALQEIGRQAGILSSYDPQSEFSRWFRTQGLPVKVSPELLEVLGLFDSWRARTDGALDAAAEIVNRTWKTAAAQGREPSAAEIASAVRAVRRQHWTLDPAAGTATHLSDTPLAMNSFVKSYIMDHAVDAAMRTPGVTAVVMNIGGDLVIRGAWTEQVNLADPQSAFENSEPAARLSVRDRAVATSGNYRRGVEIGGRHYSHIVDPRTGRTAEEIVSATVISPRPADAGALATAFCVLKPEQSRALAASVPDTEFLLITRQGTRIASPGFQQFEAAVAPASLAFAAKRAPAAFAMAAAAPGMWDTGFELAVNLELAQAGGFARRPYVAVWIEDKDKFPVRTLALWYQKERWLPELRAWYRDDRMRSMAEGNDITASVASATRSPGKYTLKWDGKDNAGKLVKAGKYTVCVEAAREHGTYQIIRQEVEFNGAPKQMQLPGNQEIGSASLDYHKTVR